MDAAIDQTVEIIIMATIEQLRDAMRRAPFTPFTVRLVDGRAFTIDHPDFIAVSRLPGGRGVTIYDADRVNQIDVLLITSLDYADQTDAESPKSSNGPAA
jgi:hypothetical protein